MFPNPVLFLFSFFKEKSSFPGDRGDWLSGCVGCVEPSFKNWLPTIICCPARSLTLGHCAWCLHPSGFYRVAQPHHRLWACDFFLWSQLPFFFLCFLFFSEKQGWNSFVHCFYVYSFLSHSCCLWLLPLQFPEVGLAIHRLLWDDSHNAREEGGGWSAPFCMLQHSGRSSVPLVGSSSLSCLFSIGVPLAPAAHALLHLLHEMKPGTGPGSAPWSLSLSACPVVGS